MTAVKDPWEGRGSDPGLSGDDVRGSRSGCGCLTWTIVVLATIAVCLAVTFLWIVPSVRKSYTIDSVDIRAAVRADGALNATERFGYTFHGRYTRVYRDIPDHRSGRRRAGRTPAAPAVRLDADRGRAAGSVAEGGRHAFAVGVARS